MKEMSPAQAAEVDRLEGMGWRVDHQDDDTVYLSKQIGRGRSLYCQIDGDGHSSRWDRSLEN